ncbi:MAG: TetR/AcrR family transcriptional regulator [Pseudomonadota bacterium]
MIESIIETFPDLLNFVGKITMTKAQFNRNDVIKQSTQLFWKNGYHGSSMQQIFDATGLKPGSIYLAFGNKEGLFKESIQCYGTNSLESIQQTLQKSPSIGLGVISILDKMLLESENSDYCSCFLIKSQLELSQDATQLNQTIKEQLLQIEKTYGQFIAQAYGYDKQQIYATQLMLQIFGIRVYGYLEKSTVALRQALPMSLPWLPWNEAKGGGWAN